MSRQNGSPREVVLPASVFATLRQELGREVGPLPTLHALHAAGYASGTEAAASWASSTGGEDPADAPAQTFWIRLGAALERRGWGTLEHRSPHDGVGLLVSRDWIEAEERDAEDRHEASCSFTSGYLAGLLTESAGGPVAVLEVSCRARDGDECVFAFGSEGTIHDLYGLLLDGAGLDDALDAL